LNDLRQDLIRLDEREEEMSQKIHTLANSIPAAKRLQSIPGIGPISAVMDNASTNTASLYIDGLLFGTALYHAPAIPLR
jgi:hypothetical protein